MIVLHLIEFGVLASILWAIRPKTRKPRPDPRPKHQDDDYPEYLRWQR